MIGGSNLRDSLGHNQELRRLTLRHRKNVQVDKDLWGLEESLVHRSKAGQMVKRRMQAKASGKWRMFA